MQKNRACKKANAHKNGQGLTDTEAHTCAAQIGDRRSITFREMKRTGTAGIHQKQSICEQDNPSMFQGRS